MAGYGDDAGLQAWLDANGYVLPESSLPPAVLRERGSRYIDATYGSLFSGYPTGGAMQERAWPRTGALYGSSEIGPDEIPMAVVSASYLAAYLEAENPGSLTTTVTPGGRIKRNKADVFEREFFDDGPAVAGGAAFGVVNDTINGLLAPLLKSDDASGAFIMAVG